eukprot:TRINITY_DN4139_c2_g1_i6.p2 TRINITY_DN4139_c2_g1~~TRINITY_DN4139_c2_g1_i6.p2  ORF type:complete len:121 (+),score=24.05 TRINITY_DN4139_c2_g1_i6:38-364(+)
MENVSLPDGLQSLTFGDEFNQSMENVEFNQSMENVRLPDGLQSLTLSYKFNNSIEKVTWPDNLKKLLTTKPPHGADIGEDMKSLLHIISPERFVPVVLVKRSTRAWKM